MNLAEVAERMMRKKIDIPTISDILDANIDDLYALQRTLGIDIEREDVIEAMSRLTWRAYEKATHILETGNPASQLALIRMMLSMMRKDIGSQSPKEMAGLITEFREAIELTDDAIDDDDAPPDEIVEDEAS